MSVATQRPTPASRISGRDTVPLARSGLSVLPASPARNSARGRVKARILRSGNSHPGPLPLRGGEGESLRSVGDSFAVRLPIPGIHQHIFDLHRMIALPDRLKLANYLNSPKPNAFGRTLNAMPPCA